MLGNHCWTGCVGFTVTSAISIYGAVCQCQHWCGEMWWHTGFKGLRSTGFMCHSRIGLEQVPKHFYLSSLSEAQTKNRFKPYFNYGAKVTCTWVLTGQDMQVDLHTVLNEQPRSRCSALNQQRPDDGQCPWQVLLVSSSRHPDQWIVPGGGMEPEEEPCGAAVREVYEEVSSFTLTVFLF